MEIGEETMYSDRLEAYVRVFDEDDFYRLEQCATFIKSPLLILKYYFKILDILIKLSKYAVYDVYCHHIWLSI